MENLVNQMMAILAAGAGAAAIETAKMSGQSLTQWLKTKLTSKTAQEKLKLIEEGKQNQEVIYGLKALLEHEIEKNEQFKMDLTTKEKKSEIGIRYKNLNNKQLKKVTKKYKNIVSGDPSDSIIQQGVITKGNITISMNTMD